MRTAILGAVAAVGLGAGTASAHPPGYGGWGGYPVYRPVVGSGFSVNIGFGNGGFVNPGFARPGFGGYPGWGGGSFYRPGFGYPGYGGFNPYRGGYGYGNPYRGGFGYPGWGRW